MSNELRENEVEEIRQNIAIDIYNYAQKVFFGKAPIDVSYRMNYGAKGAEQRVLHYIWENYIEPKGEDN